MNAVDEINRAKEQAKSEGGTIKHEYTLIKGFTYARSRRCQNSSMVLMIG